MQAEGVRDDSEHEGPLRRKRDGNADRLVVRDGGGDEHEGLLQGIHGSEDRLGRRREVVGRGDRDKDAAQRKGLRESQSHA